MFLSYIHNIETKETIEQSKAKKLYDDLLELGHQPNTQQPKFKRDRAKNLLMSADRMMDMTTRRVLNISADHKDSMYSALRWMFMNYNDLKSKRIMDITNKRLRDSEYIASLLNQELSKRLLPAINSGRKLSKEKIKDIFKFPGEILITQLYRSGLFRYDDQVNDMDFFSKLRFTLKGPNSLGGKNNNSMSASVRGLHPSMIGRIDLNVVGTSDPGTGGVLTPFCETHGLYFSDKVEPESGKFNLEKENAKFDEENGAMLIDCFNTFEEYKAFESQIENFAHVNLSSTPKEDTEKLYINIKLEKELKVEVESLANKINLASEKIEINKSLNQELEKSFCDLLSDSFEKMGFYELFDNRDGTKIRVMIVSSLAGGTGAGMFIQTAMWVRKFFEKKNCSITVARMWQNMRCPVISHSGRICPRILQRQSSS